VLPKPVGGRACCPSRARPSTEARNAPVSRLPSACWGQYALPPMAQTTWTTSPHSAATAFPRARIAVKRGMGGDRARIPFLRSASCWRRTAARRSAFPARVRAAPHPLAPQHRRGVSPASFMSLRKSPERKQIARVRASRGHENAVRISSSVTDLPVWCWGSQVMPQRSQCPPG